MKTIDIASLDDLDRAAAQIFGNYRGIIKNSPFTVQWVPEKPH